MPTQPDPDPDQLNETLECWRQAMEDLRPVWEAWREVVEATSEWYVLLQRQALYDRLRRWYLPYWLAHFLAMRCPRRWLPGLESID